MIDPSVHQLRIILAEAYREDGERDVTSDALLDDDAEATGIVVAKQEGVLCGLNYLGEILQAFELRKLIIDRLAERNSIRIAQRKFLDGERLLPDDRIVELRGRLKDLLRVERVLLNIIGRLSGIATQTDLYVQKASPYGVQILDTRKTVPGWRYLDKYATKTGGAVNYRMSLSDGVMVKDTHVDANGGMSTALERLLVAKNVPKNTPVTIEVRNMDELRAVLERLTRLGDKFGEDYLQIMLDNFSPDQVLEASGVVGADVALEVSGGVNLENLEEYAKALSHNAPEGAERYISVGALTHSIKNFDFSFRIDSLE